MSDDNVIDFEKYRLAVKRDTSTHTEINELDGRRYIEWMEARALASYMKYERQQPSFCLFVIEDDLSCCVLLGDHFQTRARFNVRNKHGEPVRLQRVRPSEDDDKLLRRI